MIQNHKTSTKMSNLSILVNYFQGNFYFSPSSFEKHFIREFQNFDGKKFNFRLFKNIFEFLNLKYDFDRYVFNMSTFTLISYLK